MKNIRKSPENNNLLLEEDLNRASSELIQVKEQIKIISEDRDQLQSQLSNLEGRQSNTTEAIEQLHQKIKQSEQNESILQDTIQNLERQIASSEEAIDQSLTKNTTNEETINSLKYEIKSIENDRIALQERIENIERQFILSEEDKNMALNKVNELDVQLQEIYLSKNALEKLLVDIQTENSNLQSDKLTALEELEQARDELGRVEQDKLEIEEKLKQSEAISQMSSTNTSTSHQSALKLADIENQRDKLVNRVIELEDEKESLTSSSQNLQNNFVTYKQTTAAELAEAQLSLINKSKELKEALDRNKNLEVTISELQDRIKTIEENAKGEINALKEARLLQIESEQNEFQKLLDEVKQNATKELEAERLIVTKANDQIQSLIAQVEAKDQELNMTLTNIQNQKLLFEQERIDYLNNEISDQEGPIKIEVEEINKLKAELEQKTSELEKRSNTLAEREDDLREKLALIEHDQKHTEDAQRSIWTEREFIDQKNELITTLETRIGELEEQYNAGQEKIFELQTKLEEISKESPTLSPGKRGSGMMINVLPDTIMPTNDPEIHDTAEQNVEDFKQPLATIVSSFDMEEGDATSTDFDQNVGVLLGVSPKNSADHNAESSLKELNKLRKDLATAEKLRRDAYELENHQMKKIDQLEKDVRDKQGILSRVASEKAAIENLLYTFAVEKKAQINFLKGEIIRIEERGQIERELITKKNDEKMRDELSKLENFLKSKNQILSGKSTDSDYQKDTNMTEFYSVQPSRSEPTYIVETGDISNTANEEATSYGKGLQERETRHGYFVETIDIQPYEDQIPFEGKVHYRANQTNSRDYRENQDDQIPFEGAINHNLNQNEHQNRLDNEPENEHPINDYQPMPDETNYYSRLPETTPNPAEVDNHAPAQVNNEKIARKSSLDEWLESDDEDRYNEDVAPIAVNNDQDLPIMQNSMVIESNAVKDSGTLNSDHVPIFSQTKGDAIGLKLTAGMPKFADSDVILVTSSRSEPHRPSFNKFGDTSAKMGESDAWKKSPGKSGRETEWRSKARVIDSYVKKEDNYQRFDSNKDYGEFEYEKKQKPLKDYGEFDYEKMHQGTHSEGMKKSASVKDYSAKRHHKDRRYRDEESEFYVKKESPSQSPVEPSREPLHKNKSEKKLSDQSLEKNSPDKIPMRKSATAKEFESQNLSSPEMISQVRVGKQDLQKSSERFTVKSAFLADIADLGDEDKKSEDEWIHADKKMRQSDRNSESQRSSYAGQDARSNSVHSSLFESAKEITSARHNKPLEDPFGEPPENAIIQDNSSRGGTGSALWSDILKDHDFDQEYNDEFEVSSRPSLNERVESLPDQSPGQDSERRKKKRKQKKKDGDNIDLNQLLQHK